MAIDDFKVHPMLAKDPEAQARSVGNIRAVFADRVRTHGLTSAKRELAIKFGVEASREDVAAAEAARDSAAQSAFRQAQPFAAAYGAGPAPNAKTPGEPARDALRAAQRMAPDGPTLTAEETLSAARARVAAEAPEANAARDAWAHAGNHMTQDQFGGDIK